MLTAPANTQQMPSGLAHLKFNSYLWKFKIDSSAWWALLFPAVILWLTHLQHIASNLATEGRE